MENKRKKKLWKIKSVELLEYAKYKKESQVNKKK